MKLNQLRQEYSKTKNFVQVSQYIPTRFDDIRNDIAAEQAEKYYKTIISNTQNISKYKLGDVVGKILNQIV